MTQFTTPLLVEFLTNTSEWRVLEEFTYVVGDERLGRWTVDVPKGFTTDFASVPKFLWPIFPPTGRWGKAAVIHDYLYRTGLASRAVSDAIFLEAMHVLGVSWWKRMVMYLSVRMFGRSSHTKIPKYLSGK
jgi:hypothetical protein